MTSLPVATKCDFRIASNSDITAYNATQPLRGNQHIGGGGAQKAKGQVPQLILEG